LAIAIGAAVAESLYALIAFAGLTAVLTSYPMLKPASRAIVGVILAIVGVQLVRHRAKARDSGQHDTNRHAHYALFGFTITAINPTLAITWAVATAALHAALPASFKVYDAFPFAIGVGFGIVGWFWVLLRVMCRFRKTLSPATINRVVRGTGGVLVAAGIVIAGRALFTYAKSF
jgi:threonine/homoserine/homoserine lactone efflux protein